MDIWSELKQRPKNEVLIEEAIERGLALEQLLRVALRYKEAIIQGNEASIVRNTLFSAAAQLSKYPT